MNSINSKIEAAAHALGFQDVFFLRHESEKTAILLVYPYLPFDTDTFVPAYYIASNTAYHAMRKLMSTLMAENITVELANFPIKKFAEQHGIGKCGKNTLLHLTAHGSRIVLFILLSADAIPMEYDVPTTSICENCHICESACPTGAITKAGYIREKCIRNFMDTPPYPEYIAKHIHTYCGCEICMSVCPYNAALPHTRISDEYLAALAPERILAGDIKPAKALLGSNVKTSRLKTDAQLIVLNKK